MLRKCEVEVPRQARYRAWWDTAPGQAGAHRRVRARVRAASWASCYTRVMQAGQLGWPIRARCELENLRWIPPKRKKDFPFSLSNTTVSSF